MKPPVVRAMRVDRTGFPPAYAEYRVIEVSTTLPDGLYTLTTIGGAHLIRHFGGHWLAA